MLRLRRKPPYPNFLIIGAQKAGTTWLHRNLTMHPQLWMPKEKELHYFDEKLGSAGSSLKTRLKGNRPEDGRWRRQANRQFRRYSFKDFSAKDAVWDLRYFLGKPSDKWYASLFNQGRRKISGEATPDYSTLDEKTIAHVREIMPEARIILMLRNPMERAWSQAMMDLTWGLGLTDIPNRRFNRHFMSRRSRALGDYLQILNNWREFYPEEQIFVGFLEDANFYPGRLMHRVYRFLGADTSIKYRVIKQKIHTRDVEQMPKRLAIRLARLYREEIGHLDEQFGGYASFWHYCARRLDEDPPRQATIPYPFTESFLWDEWVSSIAQQPAPGSKEAEAQSGPLSSVRIKD